MTRSFVVPCLLAALVAACTGSAATVAADSGAGDAAAGAGDAGAKPEAGGADVGGAGSDAAGGTASVKFCNSLRRAGGVNADITLVIGDPPLQLTTASNTCAPVVGQACPTVTAGAKVPVALLDGATSIVKGTVSLSAGLEYALVATVDGAGAATLGYAMFNAAFKCATAEPIGRSDGGAPPEAGARADAADATID